MKHFQLTKIAAGLAVIGGLTTIGSQAVAAAPKVGTSISNIATATYVDNTGASRTVSSNEVKTLVAQVGSFVLKEDRTTTAVPNGKVSMSHTLTNTGNGPDTFQFSLSNESGDDFDFASGNYKIYIDKNGDGIPDDSVNYADAGRTITLEAGQHVQVIVEATTPSTATSGQKGKLKLTATTTNVNFYPVNPNNPSERIGISDSDIDTITITDGATIRLSKAASVSSAKANDEITYTLTFTNTGNATAKNVTIFDILPANVEYKAGSAKYSGAAVTDALGDDNYYFDAGRVMLNVPSLAPNSTGSLVFTVKVLSTTSTSVENIAYVDPDGKPNPSFDPAKPVGPGNEPTLPLTPGSTQPEDQPNPTDTTTTPSNPSIVTVSGRYQVAVNDTKASDLGDNNTLPAPADDKIVKNGQQGVPVVFGNSTTDGDMIVVHNSGDRVDTFNITVDTSQLPAGAVVTILKSDGATPLTDTNGDGIPDTGPLQPKANASTAHQDNYVVRVTLPSNYTNAANTPVDIKLTTTSVSDSKVKDTLLLQVGEIKPAAVDVVSRPKDSSGNPLPEVGDGPNTGLVKGSTPPAVSEIFDITIVNEGDTPDNYDIKVPGTIPPGWTVEIFEKDSSGNCAAKVTNSGNIESQGSKSFCLVVTPPADTPANTVTKIGVEIQSPSSGAKDTIDYEVTVEEARSLSFTPDNTGTIAPGGTIQYGHVLTNTGNVVEGAGNYLFDLKLSSTLSGVNSSIYVDYNKDGILQLDELVTGTTDTQRTASFNSLLAKTGTAGLSAGESVTVYVKVEAPASATSGQTDTTVISLTPAVSTDPSKTPAALKVTDLTVINLGQVRLIKTQAVSSDCTPPTSDAVYTQIQSSAKPGECVYYKIVATNEGNAIAQDINITDKVPAYTTYKNGLSPVDASAPNDATKSAIISGGNVSYKVTTLQPSASATLKFGVEINK